MTAYNIYQIPYKIRGLEYLNLLDKYLESDTTGENTFRIKQFSWRELFLGTRPKDERRIVHIHWETNIYGSKYVFVSFVRMLYRFSGLFLLKLCGIKTVWTMHNVLAHDYPHPWIDRLGKSLMWYLADRVIIQEKVFADEEASLRKSSQIVCIPQGNYVGIYGPLWQGDKQELRQKYGVQENELVLLSLGSIRPYKALPQLIDSVTEVRKRGAKVCLVIAGKVSDEYLKVIQKKVSNQAGIILRPGFVPDEQVPEILALADYSIFYYEDSSLSSAAMILSLSYGTPVITRDIPASGMIKPGVNGSIFHDAKELEDILAKLSEAQKLQRDAIMATVAHQDWRTVTYKLKQVYINLWAKAKNEN